jgi:hypothetical protein
MTPRYEAFKPVTLGDMRGHGCRHLLCSSVISALCDISGARNMTLLVAGVSGSTIWMVSDAAISGGNLDAREREYQIKVMPSIAGDALVGFAGDQYHGNRLMFAAASTPKGDAAIRLLTENNKLHPSTSFAYGYVDEKGIHLVRVSNGTSEELSTLFLGEQDAFAHFQRIRHRAEIDPAPEAVIAFVCGARGSARVPKAASDAITSMLRLFAERAERDVGGWATPYLLTNDGASVCNYAYSVSDPILTRIGPGSIVPHGTAQAGGFGLSVTELGLNQGLVVYWLQQPGGTVYVRGEGAYESHTFEGPPPVFKEKASAGLGQQIDLWFGEQPHAFPESITIMRDEKGVPSMIMAKHGDSFSFSVLNVSTPFKTGASMDFRSAGAARDWLSNDHLSLALSDDKSTATLNLMVADQPSTRITLRAAELDTVIATLGEARAAMTETVSNEPRHGAGSRELMVVDPAWRAEAAPHRALNGITLRLRHVGLGWVTFLLPHHEARALGEWLCGNSVIHSSH